MYARNLGNVVAREVVDADIDIKPEVKARAKVEIAKGKPRLMFSKSLQTQEAKNAFNNITEDLTNQQIKQEVTAIQEAAFELGLSLIHI